MVEISTSILSVKKGEESKTFFGLEKAKTDYFHIDVMDGKFLEKNTVYQIVSLGLDELRVIEEKDYKNITLYTIKKIKKIIDYEIKDEDMEFIYLKFNERKELKNLIELYYRKDGDIKRALDLLKIAIRP